MGLNGCPLLPTTCEESSSFFFFFKVFKHNFICLFIFGFGGSSLVVASGEHSHCVWASHYGGFSCYGAWTLGNEGFSSWGSWALQHRFNSCGAPA